MPSADKRYIGGRRVGTTKFRKFFVWDEWKKEYVKRGTETKFYGPEGEKTKDPWTVAQFRKRYGRIPQIGRHDEIKTIADYMEHLSANPMDGTLDAVVDDPDYENRNPDEQSDP